MMSAVTPKSQIVVSASRDSATRKLKLNDRVSRNPVSDRYEMVRSALKLSNKLCKVSLAVAAMLFLAQMVLAGCLCRPAVVTWGLWVALFFLSHGILGVKASTSNSHALLVGFAWFSAIVAVVGIAATGYLFSGHLVVACISVFHHPDHDTVIRLYIVEITSLIASVPCLIGAVCAIITGALTARAARVPKENSQPPMVIYLQGWQDPSSPNNQLDQSQLQQQRRQQHPVQGHPNTSVPSTATASAPTSMENPSGRSSPPPSYNQIVDESFA